MSPSDKKNVHSVHLEKASRLGPTIFVDGEIKGQEDLVVEGKVQGKIDLPESDLLIADQGRVEAEIRARNITIKGEVIGNIEASGLVVIERTGRMKGNLSASVISVEDGAQFKGMIKILNKG